MSWFRLVWDLREPPEAIVRGERPVGRKVLENVAAELAGTFSVEAICAHLPTVPELREKAEQMFEAGAPRSTRSWRVPTRSWLRRSQPT